MRKTIIWAFIIAALGVSGCNEKSAEYAFVPIEPQVNTDVNASEDLPDITTTATAVIARVNGEPISVVDFQRQVRHFQNTQVSYAVNQGQTETLPIEEQALDNLINQIIIIQAAQRQGISISDDALNLHINELKQGQTPEQFNNWLALNNFTNADFERTLRVQLTAAEVFAAVAAQTPTAVEQVHARQILVSDPELAHTILSSLQAGNSFATLALQYSEDESSSLNGGDLGWFPKDAQLLPPQVEDIAFNLPVGEISSIIESDQGYHIIKVLLKEQNRPLTPQHRQLLQRQLFNQWLAQQRASAQIEHYAN